MAFTDAFTRTDSATVGNGWVEQNAATGQILSNVLRCTGGGNFEDNYIEAPSSADYINGETVVDFVMNTTAVPQIAVRISGTGSTFTCYLLFWNGGTLTLRKVVNNVNTTLDSGAATVNTTDTYRLTFTISGNTKTCVLRNVTTATDLRTLSDTADSAITGSGKTGVSIHTAGQVDYDDFSSTPATTAVLTGTTTSTIDEDDITTGSKTTIATLADDTWVTAGATFNAQRQAIIDACDSSQSETLGWNLEVRDKEAVTAVVRTSDTVVTITWAAASAYNITAQETITMTVPAAALTDSAISVTATPTFTIDTAVPAVIGVNYSINVASGITNIAGGRFLGDAGILLCGDSNMCGDGGGVSVTLDATLNTIYEWGDVSQKVQAINLLSTPYFDHTLNSGLDEVGPDVQCCERYAVERAFNRRIVGLPCGDSGSGFSTSQWESTEAMYVLAQSLVDDFLADNDNNTLEAIVFVLGANDTTTHTQSQWETKIDGVIDEFQSTAFATTGGMPSFATVPIIFCGLAPDWYVGTPARQAIQDAIEGIPARKTYTGYADTTGLASQSGDAIHLSGASNRTLGYTEIWDALIAAEANT